MNAMRVIFVSQHGLVEALAMGHLLLSTIAGLGVEFFLKFGSELLPRDRLLRDWGLLVLSDLSLGSGNHSLRPTRGSWTHL